MHDDLEQRLAHDLKIDTVTDPRWPRVRWFLNRRELFDSARTAEIVGDIEGYIELRAAARDLLKIIGGMPEKEPPGSEQDSPDPVFEPVGVMRVEACRAAALSEWYGATANARPDVRRFRETYLGRTLTRSESRRFLQSWPNRLFPSSMLVTAFERGTMSRPYLEDSAEPVVEGSGNSTVLRVDPPGWTMSGTGVSPQYMLQHLLKFRYIELDETHYWRTGTSYGQGSVVDELVKLGSQLEHAYGWDEGEGVIFVLSGVSPFVPPGRVQSHWSAGNWHRGGVITLEVQPWVSVDTLTDAFRRAQRQYFQGHRNRAISERHSELFRFIVQRTRFREEETGCNILRIERKGTWTALLRAWNAEHPEWSYASWRQLAQDFKRTRDRIVYPPLLPPRS